MVAKSVRFHGPMYPGSDELATTHWSHGALGPVAGFPCASPATRHVVFRYLLAFIRRMKAFACSDALARRTSTRFARTTSPICGELRTNAVCYGPFTEGAAKQMETE
jgi:hypothetical protein